VGRLAPDRHRRRSGGDVGSHRPFTELQHRESARSAWLRAAVYVDRGRYRLGQVTHQSGVLA
jgi:hypothetical protein